LSIKPGGSFEETGIRTIESTQAINPVRNLIFLNLILKSPRRTLFQSNFTSLNMSQAGIWTLKNATAAESIASDHIEYSLEHGGINSHESIIGQDRRVRALEGDFMDGGRYRCKCNS
jgi:hypothetical protein